MREVKTVKAFCAVTGARDEEVQFARHILAALGQRTPGGRRVFTRDEIDAILDDAITDTKPKS